MKFGKIKFLALLMGIMTLLTISSIYLLSNINSATAQKDENAQICLDKVKELTKGEFGEAKILNSDKIAEEDVITIENNKFLYRFSVSDKVLNLVSLKDSGDRLKTGTKKTQSEVEGFAKQYLKQFGDFNDTRLLTSYNNLVNEREDNHEFIFEGIASNEIKTGDHARIVVNNEGELISFIQIKGNKALAESVSPKVSKEKAIEIALNYIKTKYPDFNKAENKDSFKETYDVKIFKNKPVIEISIENVKILNTLNGYFMQIDANTGEVLFDDYSQTFLE